MQITISILNSLLRNLLNRHIDIAGNKTLKNPYLRERMTIPKHFFMPPEIKTWLKDIELSIKEIHEFLPSTSIILVFRMIYKPEKLLKEILKSIGEAVKRIIEVEPHILISDSRKMLIPETG